MFDVKFVFLWTDAVLWLLVLGLIGYVVYVLRTEELARKWRKVLNNKPRWRPRQFFRFSLRRL